jgi:hypothetical protein
MLKIDQPSFWHHPGTTAGNGSRATCTDIADDPELPDLFLDGPPRDRTEDPLIKRRGRKHTKKHHDDE